MAQELDILAVQKTVPYPAVEEPPHPAPGGVARQVSSWFSGRLRSIDALRGVAAVGVVLFHAHEAVPLDPSRWFGALLNGTLFFGRYGVWLFFVISGFCIHLRWVRKQRASLSPHINFLTFWRRRYGGSTHPTWQLWSCTSVASWRKGCSGPPRACGISV